MTIKKYIPLAVKQRARALQSQVKLINARHYCPVCESRVSAFLPLPEDFLETQRRYGFPYEDGDAETCNFAEYFCPSCEALTVIRATDSLVG